MKSFVSFALFLKKITVEVCASDKVSSNIVVDGEKKIPTSIECVKDAKKSDQPMTVIGMANVSNVNEIFENDGRYMYLIRVSANGIARAFHFEAYFERSRDLCHMNIAYVNK